MSVDTPPPLGDLVTIGPEECLQLLTDAPWVRVGFVTDGRPQIFPVNHVVHDGAIFFRTAPGSKLGSAAASSEVAVEADGGDPDQRIGWSVVAHGRSSIVTDAGLAEALFALPFEPWALPDERSFWVRVDVSEFSGRRIVRD